MKNNEPSFNKSYKILQDIAEKLRNQTEPDIDSLVPMIEQATQAYAVCKERLGAVKEALKEHLPEELQQSEHANKVR